MMQQSIPVEYGDQLTVTVYDEAHPKVVYLDIAVEGKSDITYVRLSGDQIKQVRKALKKGLEAIS